MAELQGRLQEKPPELALWTESQGPDVLATQAAGLVFFTSWNMEYFYFINRSVNDSPRLGQASHPPAECPPRAGA